MPAWVFSACRSLDCYLALKLLPRSKHLQHGNVKNCVPHFHLCCRGWTVPVDLKRAHIRTFICHCIRANHKHLRFMCIWFNLISCDLRRRTLKVCTSTLLPFSLSLNRMRWKRICFSSEQRMPASPFRPAGGVQIESFRRGFPMTLRPVGL